MSSVLTNDVPVFGTCTCTSGALSATLERSAALLGACKDSEVASWMPQQQQLGRGGGLSDDEDGGAEPVLDLRRPGITERSAAQAERDDAALLQIDPCGSRVWADLNFLSQRPLAESREVTLLPLTPLQVTYNHVEASVLVLSATAGRNAALASRKPYAHAVSALSRRGGG